VRLLLVSAHPLVRAGFRHALQTDQDLEIVGESGCLPEAIALAAAEHPDLVLVDPDAECIGFRAVAALSNAVDCRVLVVTSTPDPRLYARAMENGAAGVMSKDNPVELLRRAVEKVAAGEVWLERGKTASLLRHVMRRARDPEAEKINALTKREREVVALVGEGLKNTVIAERLFISEATVRNHLTSILGKLGLSDRFELAVYAFRHELAGSGLPLVEAQPAP
jgi:two-component system, NarL family, nitrate/nitrite response regulator NarL